MTERFWQTAGECLAQGHLFDRVAPRRGLSGFGRARCSRCRLAIRLPLATLWRVTYLLLLAGGIAAAAGLVIPEVSSPYRPAAITAVIATAAVVLLSDRHARRWERVRRRLGTPSR